MSSLSTSQVLTSSPGIFNNVTDAVLELSGHRHLLQIFQIAFSSASTHRSDSFALTYHAAALDNRNCGGGSELISLLTRHSILVADWSRVYLVHTSCVLEGDPVVRRYTISIDFSAVVATAPPRYHLVALLLYTSCPRSSRIPPFRVLPIRFAPTRRSRRCYITSRMNTYKTFVRLAHGNDSCQPSSVVRNTSVLRFDARRHFRRKRSEALFLSPGDFAAEK